MSKLYFQRTKTTKLMSVDTLMDSLVYILICYICAINFKLYSIQYSAKLRGVLLRLKTYSIVVFLSCIVQKVRVYDALELSVLIFWTTV